MTPSLPCFPPTPGHGRALGGLWRLTYPAFLAPRRVLVLAGLGALLYILTAQNVRHHEPEYFQRWAVEFYLAFLLPAVTFLSAAGAVRDDMLPVSVDYVLTRPVRRAWFVLFRYLSQMACLQLASLVPLAALAAAGMANGPAQLDGLLPRIAYAQVLVVAGFSAVGFLFGALTARYLVLGMIYGLIVEVGVGQIPTQLSRLSMTHHVRAMFGAWVPGLHGAGEPEGAFVTTCVFLVFGVIALAATVVVFSWREFAGNSSGEK